MSTSLLGYLLLTLKVSANNLEIETETVETRLRAILQYATIWDAILLLNEADVFLKD